MQLNPCLVWQARKTRSGSVWPLRLWITASNPRWHLSSRQGKKCSSCQTLSFLLVIFQAHERLKASRRRQIACPAEMAAECQWRMPFSRRGGFPAARCETVPGKQSKASRRRRYDEWGRDHNGPWGMRPGLRLSTHLSWPSAGGSLVSWTDAEMSQH